MNATYETQYLSEDRTQQLLNTWRPLLEATDTSLKPLETRKSATMCAVLLENQYNYMRQNPDIYGRMPALNESVNNAGVFTSYSDADPVFTNPDNATQPVPGQYGNSVNPTNNDFYARGDARLPSVIMPMIRRTFPELLANEIVGIQPMSGPVGMAFALRFKYDAENLAQFTPDGGSTVNPATSAYPWRGDGQEASYNYLNTGHTGLTSDALTGNGVTADGAFDFVSVDQGVANLLANVECSTAIPQMSMTIEKTAVEAGSRKLALKYSLELEQDLMNMHGISVDDEMTSMMSYELQAEIDRELLMRMIQITLNAGADTGYTIWSPASADGRWSAERSVNLWQHIRVQSRLISLRNRRGAANFAVVTPYAAAILETLPNFKTFQVDGNVNQVSGSSKAGQLGSLKVFVDTRTEAQFQAGIRGARVDYILLGYKGTESHDSGIIYLPYIPVMIQRTMGPNDFSPRVGLSTRYAIAANMFGASNYYHLIILTGLTEGFEGSTKKFMW